MIIDQSPGLAPAIVDVGILISQNAQKLNPYPDNVAPTLIASTSANNQSINGQVHTTPKPAEPA